MKALLIVVAAIGLTWFVLGVFFLFETDLGRLRRLGPQLRVSAWQPVDPESLLHSIVILVIVQAHRVIGWANQLRGAGVPLTAKP
jgi:hypothetical protein